MMSMLMILHLKAYSVVVLKRRRIVIIFWIQINIA